MTNVALESQDGFGVAFSEDLHATVREIANPSLKTLSRSGRFGEEPETNSLHATTDDVPPGD
jgi:hypothetical protein